MAEIKDWMSLAKPDAEWEQVSILLNLRSTVLMIAKAINDNMGGNVPDVSCEQ